MTTKKILVFYPLLIIIIGLIAYSNSYHCSFHFDDRLSIQDNPIIKDLDNLNPLNNPSILKNTRYIGLLSFALNYRLHGLDVVGFHLLNNLIHLGNALLIYLIVLLLFKTPPLLKSSFSPLSQSIALCVSLLFVTHPIQTQAVTYIAQRYASLATLFYLSSLFFYLKARLRREFRGRLHWGYYALSVLSSVLAMKTKEISFTLPFTIAVFDLVLFRNTPIRKRIQLILPLML
ncbi:MAG: tetratricopeptide repeat protein, partial [Nitrospirae bacterium]